MRPPIHFQSIYRTSNRVACEPLCDPVPPNEIEKLLRLSPRRAEITCKKCLFFLMSIKEPSYA
jgi:hypothetical protein